MLAELLKSVTPDMLVTAVKNNPGVVLGMLQKFETYVAFGNALTLDQQLCISTNLSKVTEFIKSDVGKSSLSVVAEEFVNFVKK